MRYPEMYGHDFKKARTTNQTSGAFVSKVATATEPIGDAGTATGASIIELGQDSNLSRSVLKILPYGVGSDDNTMSVRVIGWSKAGPEATRLWIPVVLCELACTLSTAVGVASKYVLDTDRFADAMTLTFGNTNVSVELPTQPANTIAIAKVTLVDFQKLELSFSTGASATSCNALVSIF